MTTKARGAAPFSLLLIFGLALASPAVAASDPDPPAPPAGTASPGSADPSAEAGRQAAVAEFEAEIRLGERLSKTPGDVQAHTRYLLDLVWSDAEPDAGLKSAALRRLRETEPRIITSVVTQRIALSPPEVQLGMLDLVREVYTRIGGLDAALDEALAGRIRDRNERVASKAIAVTSELGIQAAYIPMREAASMPGSAVRAQAIEALGRLRDPRAVVFFKKLLETDDAPRVVLYRGLGEIGRPAALFLKEKLSSPRAEDRDLACDALLGMAVGDDLTALYAYIHKYPPEGERRKRIYDTIATLEARGNERPAGSGD